MKDSMIKIAIKKSLNFTFIVLLTDIIHMGVIKVVSKINKTEIPSIPNLKLIKLPIHFFSSTNWKSDVVASKEYQRKSDKKKFTIEENIATYFEFFSMLFWDPFVIKMNNEPISGMKIIAERIGKFI